MRTPNDTAREIMRKAAEQVGALAKSAREEATLWSQTAEHLLAGDLIKADEARVKAAALHTSRRMTEKLARLVQAIGAVDPEYYDEACDDREKRSIDAMPVASAKLALELHRIIGCGDCEIEKMLEARIARG